MPKRQAKASRREARVHDAELIETSGDSKGSEEASGSSSPNQTSLSRGLVGRTQIARLLGISPSTFIRHVEGHLIKPIVDDRGWHRFSLDDIETVRQSVEITRFRRAPATAVFNRQADDHDTGPDRDTHVAILELLDAGQSPVEIAKKLRLLPRELDPVVRWWAQTKGGYFLTADQADEVFFVLREWGKARGPSTKPKEGAALVQLAIEVGEKCNAMDDDRRTKKRCKGCREEEAMYCPICARKKFSKS